MTIIGFLHPGKMGASLANCAGGAAERLWVSVGRSPATASRAAAAHLVDAGDVAALCRHSDVIVSICPPSAAETVAAEVAATGFGGVYLDANAVSPTTAARVGARFGERYVDGGVIGPPAERPGTTRLYLAGPQAAGLAPLWAGSALDVRTLADTAESAPASTLKMAYAAWTKGTNALLLTVNALASQAGALNALREEWELSQPGLRERSDRVAAGSGPKAWRFEGEMAEIAATMAAAGLPDGFHRGAEDLYRRLACFKDHPGPGLAEILAVLAARRFEPAPGPEVSDGAG
ncbi:MAG: DUF1932 domain-containing protein [Acidimicrobiia bacterium]|nr:DUF1932 domain-containing protein [Acidimicrobiia bacterium]